MVSDKNSEVEGSAAARSKGRWRRLRDRFRREEGSASIEFVILFPVYMAIFSSAFELGLHMVKQVMLDRAVDVTVRALRLGMFDDPTQELLRYNICNQALVIDNCGENVFIEMTPIGNGASGLLPSQATCIERDADGDLVPVTDYEFRDGQPNEMMLIRVCAQVNPMFPTTGLGMALTKDENGDQYRMTSTSAFVIEPRS